MHRLRRWKIQDDERQCGVHRLRGWKLLHEHRRYDFRDMYSMSFKLHFIQRKLGRWRLYL